MLRFYNLAAAEARGAHAHTLVTLGGFGVHRAQIDVPAPLSDVVGVTDIVAGLRPFAANFTNLCHDLLQKIPEVRGETSIIPVIWAVLQPDLRVLRRSERRPSTIANPGKPVTVVSYQQGVSAPVRSQGMKSRIAIWASVGFFVAGCWALYAIASSPPALTSADPLMPLVQITCPIALVRSYPMSVYFVLLANAATYGLVGLVVETVRQRLHHAK